METEDKALAAAAAIAALTAIAGVIQGDVRFGTFSLVLLALGGLLKAMIPTK